MSGPRELPVTREEAIQIFTEHGKTREQAEAFINIVGSAFARRGWIEGEPLSDDELDRNLDVLAGGQDV